MHSPKCKMAELLPVFYFALGTDHFSLWTHPSTLRVGFPLRGLTGEPDGSILAAGAMSGMMGREESRAQRKLQNLLDH